MTTQDIATAVQRAGAVLRRRPDMGMQDDSPATARWQGGARVTASHANGTAVSTDMPDELGGTGHLITPGWLFRAGLASCATTSIAMTAAVEGLTLTTLEVVARSRSDTRGLLGMSDAQGVLVPAAPQAMELLVRIAAPGVSTERLRAVVELGCRHSPIPNAVQSALPLQLSIAVEAA